MANLNIETASLQKVIQIIAPIVQDKSSSDNYLLSSILMNISNNYIVASVTNGDIYCEIKFQSETSDIGKFAVPGLLFSNIVKSCHGKHISINTEENINDDNVAKVVLINSGQSKFKLQCFDVAEDRFNNNELNIENSAEFVIDTSVLKNMLTKTICCADNKRPSFQSVLLHSNVVDNVNFLHSVSTDGSKLGVVARPIASNEIISDLLIPKKSVDYLVSLLSSRKGDVICQYNDLFLKCIIGDVIFKTKLIDGSFPKYQNVMPVKNDKILEFNTTDFINSVKEVIAITTEAMVAKIKLSVKKDELEISCEDSNNIAVNSISCIFSEDVSNESFVINCNSKFLLDILSHIDSKIVRFAILDNKSPILVRPVDDNDVRYIFMPMF